MSAAPPQSPEQIRGETLTPVSPKPLHYPSPSNIPILEASMDPAFSDTVTQTMQEPLPSVAQHTIPVVNTATTQPAAVPEHNSPEDVSMADDAAGGADPGSGNVQVSTSDTNAFNLDNTGATSLPPTSEVQESNQEAPAVDKSPSLEDASIDATAPPLLAEPAAATTASSQEASADLASQFLNNANATPAADGNIDYAALLANLSGVIAGATPTGSSNATPAPSQAPGAVLSPTQALPSNPSLPPKPPAQEKPNIHPNYTPGDDLRNYHPHTQKDGAASLPTSTLPNISTNGLPPPPHSYQNPASAMPGSAVSQPSQRGQTPPNDEDAPFDPQTQQLFDQFIQFERQNVHDGQWDKFPVGSRLFVGNLSTEKVQKKDVFRKFYRYGQLAQISLKQAYGFVQFMDAATCATALAMEQATKIRGREIHLEVSKPAKSTNRQGGDRNRRRSRSPDYNRGSSGRVDRYSGGSPRDRDNRRSRDEWRRSPSPRRSYGGGGGAGGGGGGRDDRYDGRRRQRSPSPYGARDRYGTSQPQRDELDLPFRSPDQVPDIQILVVDQIDQEYVRWVDNAMKSRGVRVDVLMLSPRWPEEAVVRRQIVEGVLAVVRLTRADRMKNKVSMRIFNRSAGANNVSFDQYVDLDPTVAADLVLRAKHTQQAQTHAPPPPPIPQQYPPPQQQQRPTPLPPQYTNYQQPPPRAAPPPQDITRIMSTLGTPSNAPPPPQQQNNADLARIMAGIGGQPRPGSTGITPDVARLLGQMGQPPPPQGQQQWQSASTHGGGGMVQPPTSQTSPADIQQLLANLTNYKPPT